MIEMLSYPFMQRAIIVGLLVSLSASLLGVSLVLRRFSMIGDGLSHVGFGALSIASVLSLSPMAVTIPVVVAAAILLLRLSERSKVSSESMIALISSSSLAIGVICVSLTTGMNTDVSSYMFGSVLSLSSDDAVLSVILSLAVLGLFILFYPRLFAVTFDENFSRATGTRTEIYNTLLAVLTAVTVVLGMRMMGALLISSLIIFPALSAMCLCRSFRAVVLSSAAISVACFLAGLVFSYFFETPTGASIVVADLICYGLFRLIGRK